MSAGDPGGRSGWCLTGRHGTTCHYLPCTCPCHTPKDPE